MDFHIINREMKTKFNLPPITYLCVSSGSRISIPSQFHIMWGNQTGIYTLPKVQSSQYRFFCWKGCLMIIGCTHNVWLPRPKLSVASVYWTYTASVHCVHWWHTGHTLAQYTGLLVYSYTGATLAPLQCMHSVHCSVCPVYTLTDTGIGSGHVDTKLKAEWHRLQYDYRHTDKVLGLIMVKRFSQQTTDRQINKWTDATKSIISQLH